MLARKPWVTLFLTSGLLAAGATPALAADASFTLKYGVLAGLTGDPAPSGQAWNASAKLGIDYIAATLERLKLPGLKVELADSQDSQGTPQQGVEAAQKLVQIDGVNVIIGDFYSSVTSAAATSVAIPNSVIMFTGGTNPSLTKLNTGSTTFLGSPSPPTISKGGRLPKSSPTPSVPRRR